MTPPTVSPEIRRAAARSAAYAFLARAFAYPLPEARARLRERLAAALAAQLPFLPRPVQSPARAALAALETTDAESLVRQHILLFTHVTSPDCPPYETAYRAQDVFRQTQLMADLAGFYRAFGLQVGGPAREQPDFIGVELDFLAFLAVKEAYATADGPSKARLCRRAERLFYRDHLGCWGAGFARRVEARAGTGFYAEAARLLGALIESQLRRLRVTPAATYGAPVPLPQPEEEGCPLGPEAAAACLAGVSPVDSRGRDE